MLLEVLKDAFFDSVKMVPFLFGAFLLLELLERRTEMARSLNKVKGAGPAVGALLGVLPECGPPILAANLFSGGVITLGTLISVFIATSDEAIVILLGDRGLTRDVIWILVTKLLIAVIAGYGVDLLHRKSYGKSEIAPGTFDHHGHHSTSIWKCALNHTVSVWLYLFIFNTLLNMVLEMIAIETLSTYLLKDSFIQPVFTALVGLIPNCAASVILTQLYMNGIANFAALIAGLCTCTGVGCVVLFRTNKRAKDCVKIVVLLYFISVAAGLLLQLFM